MDNDSSSCQRSQHQHPCHCNWFVGERPSIHDNWSADNSMSGSISTGSLDDFTLQSPPTQLPIAIPTQQLDFAVHTTGHLDGGAPWTTLQGNSYEGAGIGTGGHVNRTSFMRNDSFCSFPTMRGDEQPKSPLSYIMGSPTQSPTAAVCNSEAALPTRPRGEAIYNCPFPSSPRGGGSLCTHAAFKYPRALMTHLEKEHGMIHPRSSTMAQIMKAWDALQTLVTIFSYEVQDRTGATVVGTHN